MRASILVRAETAVSATILIEGELRLLRGKGDMSSDASDTLRPVLRKLLDVHSLRCADDVSLLRRVVDTRDDAAFRVIVERHGPMVSGVCRRALRCPFDAEDALQATFLVLLQQAASIRGPGSLASWLHGVALRVSGQLRRQQVRRTRREQRVARPDASETKDDPPWSEVACGLDEELARLPDHYREVLIQCYLEGRTRDEAAQRLSVGVDVIKGRLERARKMLAARLTKRGLTLSSGLLTVALASTTTTAACRAASLLVRGQELSTAVAPEVLSLTSHVIKGMAMTKLKLVTAGACALVVSIGLTLAQGQSVGEDRALRAAQLSNVDKPKIGKQTSDVSDEDFIRRLSLDLRGITPSPTEVHFFVTSKETRKRDVLVDLFVRERQSRKQAAAEEERKLREATDAQFRAAMEEALRRNKDATQRALENQREKSSIDSEREAQTRQLAQIQTQLDLCRAETTVKQLQLKIAEQKGVDKKELDQLRATLEMAQSFQKEQEEKIRTLESELRKRQRDAVKPPPPGSGSHPAASGAISALARMANAAADLDRKLFEDPKTVFLVDGYAKRIAGLPAKERATAVKQLHEALQSREIELRRRAALTLGAMGDKSGVPTMIEALSTATGSDRDNVIVALRILKDERAIPALRKALKDPSPYFRGIAVAALGELKAVSAYDDIVALTKDKGTPSGDKSSGGLNCLPNAPAHLACYALGALGDRRAIPVLIELLNDNDLRNSAVQALIALTNQKIEADATKWRRWLEGSQPR